MSDALMFPHVHPREFDTELEAVWFSANYYYKESYVRGGESTGVVFWDPAREKFRTTFRLDGSWRSAAVRWRDVPKGHGFVITSAWHTHVPGTRFCQIKDNGAALAACLAFSLTDGLLREFESFSGEDRTLANDATRKTGRTISFYLITATLIKRFTPGKPDKTWNKEIPSRMRGVWAG